jgi:hypothetical protein
MPRRTGELAAALAALLVAAAPARGGAQEIRIEAQVDRTELAQDEVLVLEIRLETPEPPSQLELGDTADFRVVSRAQSRQASFGLGGGGGVQIRQVIVVQVGLAPARAGALTVPAATAIVRGKRYATQPIAVKVLPAGAARPPAPRAPEPRGQAYRGWERDLVLEVRLDKREAWLGEQVTASIWLLSPLGVVRYERFTPPRYEGFWAEELETPTTLQFQVRDVNGIPTRAYLLQRVALFPTRAGALTLPAAELIVALRLGGSAFDPFGDIQRVRRQSAAVTLKVKPLPPGAPPGFESVNVGSLALEATPSEPRAVAGQPVAIRIAASGEGNVRALALPKLPAVAGARAYQPTTSEKIGPRGGRFGGTRTAETVLVPERTGELVVPALEWPCFDPRTGTYEVLRTQELRIAVAPGNAGERSAAGTNTLAAGLRPIRSDGALSRRGPPPWARPVFPIVLAAPPLLFAGLVVFERLRGRGGGARLSRAAGRVARRRLAAARRHLGRGDRAAFLAELERALTGYASTRIGRPAVGLTRGALADALTRVGGHPRAVRALAAALDAGDMARYGGAGATSADDVLAAAEHALSLLEDADWRSDAEVGT